MKLANNKQLSLLLVAAVTFGGCMALSQNIEESLLKKAKNRKERLAKQKEDDSKWTVAKKVEVAANQDSSVVVNLRKGSVDDATTAIKDGGSAANHHRHLQANFFQSIINAILSFLNIFDFLGIIPDPSGPAEPPSPPVETPAPAPGTTPAPVTETTSAPVSSNTPAPAPSSSTSAPTDAPVVPDPINEEACNPETSFMIFTGHDEVTSINKSQVIISWSPAFVTDTREGEEEKLIWCGSYTYHAIIVKGSFDFGAVGLTGEELIQFAQEREDMDVVETTDLELILDGYEEGSFYSVLVLAQTSVGHYSFNRFAAEVQMSTIDPIVNENYTRMVILDEPEEGVWAADINTDENTVTFTGGYPKEVDEIQKDDL